MDVMGRDLKYFIKHLSLKLKIRLCLSGSGDVILTGICTIDTGSYRHNNDELQAKTKKAHRIKRHAILKIILHEPPPSVTMPRRSVTRLDIDVSRSILRWQVWAIGNLLVIR